MELTPEQSIVLPTAYFHPESGLIIGSTSEYLGGTWLGRQGDPSPKMAFFKHAFVVGITPSGTTRYHVQNPEDILKLLKIVDANVSEAFIGVTADAVRDMMGVGVG